MECRDSVFCHESAEAGMRGTFVDQGGLFSYIAPEARVPANHPLRKIRELVFDWQDLDATNSNPKVARCAWQCVECIDLKIDIEERPR